MRLRISKNTRAKLPIAEDQVPLKTAENLGEYLQSAISFLQTQAVLEKIRCFGGNFCLESTIADVIRNMLSNGRGLRLRFKKLRRELKGLAKLKFNEKPLFSSNGSDTSFKLFKKASASAPEIRQPAAKKYLEPIKVAENGLNSDALHKSLQAMQEMLGQSDAAQSDLQTSFTALAKEPDAGKSLILSVKTWVSEVIDGQDGLSVQAHLLTKRVNGLIEGSRLEPK